MTIQKIKFKFRLFDNDMLVRYIERAKSVNSLFSLPHIARNRMRCNFPENRSFSPVGHIRMNVNYTLLMKRSRIGSPWPLPELGFGSHLISS